jgi:hypothetical protein
MFTFAAVYVPMQRTVPVEEVIDVTIAREGRGECDARGSKDEREVEGEGLKSREECSRERMRAKSNWRCKHDEPVELVNV